MLINYNGKEIELNYSENSADRVRHPLDTKGFSLGNLEDYYELEAIAQHNLVENATRRKPGYTLDKIVRVRQNISEINFNQQPGVKIILTGIPVYRKNGNGII